jgi:hypothetical protein
VQLLLTAGSRVSRKLQDFTSKYRRDIIRLGIIVVVAIIIRLLALTYIPTELRLDNSTYQYAVTTIMKDGIISNHFIMPLYPILLTLLGGGLKAEVIIGITSGAISVILTWALAQALFKDKKSGLVAAGVMAIYPMAIFYSAIGMTESVFIPLVLGAFLALHQNRTSLASILFVLSILTRPVMDVFAPFVIFWNALVIRKTGFSRAFRDLMVYGLFYALIMSPWWYHNMKKYDQFVRLNYGFGLVLYAGNNVKNTSGGSIGGIDYNLEDIFGDDRFLDYTLSEQDQMLRDKAIKYIMQNPSNFFKIASLKFIRFWRLLPYTPIVGGSIAAKITTLSLLPILLLACITLVTRRKNIMSFTPILGFIAFLTLVHMITIGSIRYRYPLEPLLIVFAAPSLLVIWDLVLSKIRLANERNLRIP